MKIATPLDELSEKEWARQFYTLADSFSWARYHTYRSKMSQPGYPDETLVRDRVVFVELKTEKGKVSVDQRKWINLLHKANAEIWVVRPRHLEAIAFVLQKRERQNIWHEKLEPLLRELESHLDGVV